MKNKSYFTIHLNDDRQPLVTISLEEYRSSIKETVKLTERIKYLENRLYKESMGEDNKELLIELIRLALMDNIGKLCNLPISLADYLIKNGVVIIKEK